MQEKRLHEQTPEEPVHVGIDVSKARLDVCIHPHGRRLCVTNDRVGLRRLKRELAGFPVALVAMEATAKYHRAAHRSLHAAGLPVAVVNPRRARLFAQAAGLLAKTDAIDAHALAVLAASLAPAARPPAPEILEDLQELVRARQAAVAEATALTNRRGASRNGLLRRELARRIKSVEGHVVRLDRAIEGRIAGDPTLDRRNAILRSIPGIGPATAAALLADLAELGTCTGRAAAMLAGVAPIAADSGEHAGQRHIRGGRSHLRRALYMAALAARRHNPDLATFYRRLRDNGKKPKVALTAVMRKLVLLANTLIAEDRVWQPQRP